jgi:hypothetical protein
MPLACTMEAWCSSMLRIRFSQRVQTWSENTVISFFRLFQFNDCETSCVGALHDVATMSRRVLLCLYAVMICSKTNRCKFIEYKRKYRITGRSFGESCSWCNVKPLTSYAHTYIHSFSDTGGPRLLPRTNTTRTHTQYHTHNFSPLLLNLVYYLLHIYNITHT